MAALSPTQYDRLLACIFQMHQIERLSDLPQQLLPLVSGLLPNESLTWNEIGRHGLTTAVSYPHFAEHPRWMMAARAHLHEHPVLQHYRRTKDGGAHHLTEFISRREFRRGGLYHDCYRHLRYEDHLAATYQLGTPVVYGIAIGRNKNFTETDRLLLDALMPHVRLLHQRLLMIEQLRRTRARPADAECLPQSHSATPRLTDREREILHWLGEGKTNDEIGLIVGISRFTVKNHLAHIFDKLGVPNRIGALRWLLEELRSQA